MQQDEPVTLDDLLELFPDQRIEGAHLSGASWMHWLYGILSGVGFFGLILVLFPWGKAQPLHLVGVGLATATLGILSLLAFRWIANLTQGVILYGGNVIVLVLFYIVKFIGFSYSAANDPEAGFWLSFLGFTCGVGFCEELTKAMPVLVHVRGEGGLRWRGMWIWGVASGIGFGVAEGIMYSRDFYNGVATGGIYLVRFVSCVALHATWSGAAAISICNNRKMVQTDSDWSELLASCIKVLGVPILLHGLYDTLLKRQMEGLALLAAVLSFLWLVLLVERARRHEPGLQPKAALVPV